MHTLPCSKFIPNPSPPTPIAIPNPSPSQTHRHSKPHQHPNPVTITFALSRTRKKTRGLALFFNSFVSLCFQTILQAICQHLGVSVQTKFVVLGFILYVAASVLFMGGQVIKARGLDAVKVKVEDEESHSEASVNDGAGARDNETTHEAAPTPKPIEMNEL